MELCGHRQLHSWRDAAERHVGPLVVVGPEPTHCFVLHLLDCLEQGSGKPSVADRSVVALNVGVLLRFAWLDVLDPDALLLCPGEQRAADVFGTVIAANDARFRPA